MDKINDINASIDAVVIYFDECARKWMLGEAGTQEDCRRYWDRIRLEGFGGRMMMIHGSNRRFVLPNGQQFDGETDAVAIGPDGRGELLSG